VSDQASSRASVGRLAWRILFRHRGRILFFASCIAVGIGFLFAIGNILDTLQASIAGRARKLMAADATLSSARPFPKKIDGLLATLQKEKYRTSRMYQFVSKLRPPKSKKGVAPTLVSIKAVQPSYPFYGSFVTEPAYQPEAFQKKALCYIGKSLQLRQQLKVGERIRLGNLWFTIAGVIKNEPDQVVSFGGIAPRVIIPFAMAKKTGLLQFGSRINHQVLLAVPKLSKKPAAVLATALKKRLEKELNSPYIRISAYTEAQPTVREAMRRSASFFLLASLVALLLGAIGMAASVTAFLNEQIQTVGVLRSLGLGPRDIASLYLRICLGMGILGGLGGVLFGALLSTGGLTLLTSALGVTLQPQIHLANLAEGMILAIVLAVGLNYAAIRSLAGLRPYDILSGRVHRIALSRTNIALTLVILLVGLALFTFKGSRSVLVTGFFTTSLVGTLIVCLLLILVALAVIGLLMRGVSGSTPVMFAVRHGLRQLIRQRTRTLTFLLALSLGVSLLSTLRLLEHSIITEIQTGASRKIPDVFLVDIQVDQVKALKKMMRRHVHRLSRLNPLIRARLTHINDKEITTKDTKRKGGMTMEARSRARFLAREYNLSYKDKLGSSEQVIEGRFWKPGTTALEISLEQRFAQRTGVKLGDTMTFDVVGRAIRGKVTSIRKINWMSMMPNFFVIFPRRALQKAPQILITSANIGSRKKVNTFLSELVKVFPNISAIYLAPIIKRVRTIIRYFVGALRGLAWVCVAVGLLILAGTLNMGRGERRNKVALMRTLGLRRRTLLWIDCVELLVIGLLTAAIALLLSLGLTTLFAYFMNIRFYPSWVLFAEVAIAATCLPLVVGLLINRSIYSSGVMDNLRNLKG
jgi:putative ABC transport system permease protein